jgi:hypothetical protein
VQRQCACLIHRTARRRYTRVAFPDYSRKCARQGGLYCDRDAEDIFKIVRDKPRSRALTAFVQAYELSIEDQEYMFNMTENANMTVDEAVCHWANHMFEFGSSTRLRWEQWMEEVEAPFATTPPCDRVSRADVSTFPASMQPELHRCWPNGTSSLWLWLPITLSLVGLICLTTLGWRFASLKQRHRLLVLRLRRNGLPPVLAPPTSRARFHLFLRSRRRTNVARTRQHSGGECRNSGLTGGHALVALIASRTTQSYMAHGTGPGRAHQATTYADAARSSHLSRVRSSARS